MSTPSRPRVLLADDHRLMAEGLQSLLATEFDVVGVVEDGRAMVEAAKELHPDVIVADITMPHLSGIDALALLRREGVDARVVVLTMHHDVAYARRALEEGAAGFVLKHAAASELLAAVRGAIAGEVYLTPAIAGPVLHAMRGGQDDDDPSASLTPRQREIMHLLAEGRSAKEIGGTLGISARTVEFHKYQMMERLDVKTTAELILFAIKHGVVEV